MGAACGQESPPVSTPAASSEQAIDASGQGIPKDEETPKEESPPKQVPNQFIDELPGSPTSSGQWRKDTNGIDATGGDVVDISPTCGMCMRRMGVF